jgi:hypothetical protein
MSRNIASARFTRPADTTAYASGDLVANSTTAGSVVPLSIAVAPGARQIRRVRIHTSSTNVTNAAFRVHFYGATVTAANGDNAAWSTSGAANYFGSVDVTVDKAFTDGAAGSATTEINCAVSGTLFALVEARGAYTPTSAGVFNVTVETVAD